MSALVRSWPLAAFFGLAFAFTWSLLPLARASIAVSLAALCGPAVAALITAALVGGTEWRALLDRITRWRVPLGWYAVAVLAPVAISALATALESLAGARGPIRPLPISPLQAVVFALVVGEEIGWRGYALPMLRSRHGPWRASVVLGVAWALWHLPLFFMPAMPQYGSPFLPFIGYTIALSVLLTLLAERTGGSVVLATLFHGAVNTLALVNESATPELRGWGNAVGYGLVAAVAGGAAWGMRLAPVRLRA